MQNLINSRPKRKLYLNVIHQKIKVLMEFRTQTTFPFMMSTNQFKTFRTLYRLQIRIKMNRYSR